MPLSDMVHEIAVLVQSVAGITAGAGKVTEYLNYTESEEKLIEAYVANAGTATALLHAWIVTREATRTKDQGAGLGTQQKNHAIAIHGYRAIASSSESEKTHQDLVEAVCDQFNNLQTNGKNRALANGAGVLITPVQVEEFNAVLFANSILCWHAKLTFVVTDKFLGP